MRTTLSLPGIAFFLLLLGCGKQDAPETDAVDGPVVVRTAIDAPNRIPDPPAPTVVVDTGLGALPDSMDFLIAGLSHEVDSAGVRARIGAPDSARIDDFPFDYGAKVATWFYPDRTIYFGTRGHFKGIEVRDAAVATHRGLRVGDSVQQVRALYGEPRRILDELYEYYWSAMDLRVLRIQLRSGTVASIYLGWLDD